MNISLIDYRLDIHHEIMLLTSNRDLYKAPISPTETHRVLDIGTGTGIWSIDYAEQNPNTEVIGMDLRLATGFLQM